jgi:hypothetical protein
VLIQEVGLCCSVHVGLIRTLERSIVCVEISTCYSSETLVCESLQCILFAVNDSCVGTAKSQLLKYVEKTSHRAVFTTGQVRTLVIIVSQYSFDCRELRQSV